MLPNGELSRETAAPREEERRPRRAPRGDKPEGARGPVLPDVAARPG